MRAILEYGRIRSNASKCRNVACKSSRSADNGNVTTGERTIKHVWTAEPEPKPRQ